MPIVEISMLNLLPTKIARSLEQAADHSSSKRDAEIYNTNTYPEVVKIFSKLTDGTPKVQTSEVVNSTYHETPVRRAIPA